MRATVRKVLWAIGDYKGAFFAKSYVEGIAAQARALRIQPPGPLLKAGCQAGRLVVPHA